MLAVFNVLNNQLLGDGRKMSIFLDSTSIFCSILGCSPWGFSAWEIRKVSSRLHLRIWVCCSNHYPTNTYSVFIFHLRVARDKYRQIILAKYSQYCHCLECICYIWFWGILCRVDVQMRVVWVARVQWHLILYFLYFHIHIWTHSSTIEVINTTIWSNSLQFLLIQPLI